MDAFISQTWAGAWQDFWSDTTLGWTFQLSNMLAHQAQIAGGNATRSTPCCLYHVVDTWDSFEPWDTLHTVPQKLAWGVWAFSHAALRSPNRLTLPQGAYLSWIGNRFSEIWSAQDVEFLSHHLDAAQEDARELEEVFGPEMVLDREAVLASLISHPGQNLAAFTDDQIGLLNKWGFGCLTAARADQICSSQPEGRVWQIPPEDAKLVTQESPVILAGRADAITAEGLRRSGVEHLGRPLAPEYEFLIRANDQHLHEPIFSPDRFQLGIGDGRVLVETQSTPLLVEGADGKTFYWQPQDWFQHGAIIRQSHLGSFRAYQTLSNRFHHARTASAAWICEEVPLESPVTVHIWRSAGSVKVLVGNLETGIIGDSRLPRKVTISLNMERLGISGYPDFVLESLQNANILAPEPSSEIHTLRFVIEVGPQGFDLFRLVPERSITQRGT
jgi:hypothetical protein